MGATARGQHEKVERVARHYRIHWQHNGIRPNRRHARGPKVAQINLTPGVTEIAADIYWLHWMMLIICTIIFIGVFGVMFYSIWAHRKSKGHKASVFHEHLGVEVAWTVIPFIIVIAMALPATKTVVAMKDTSSADLTVKATGYQWKWGYEYLDGPAKGVSFLSNLSTPVAEIMGDAKNQILT